MAVGLDTSADFATSFVIGESSAAPTLSFTCTGSNLVLYAAFVFGNGTDDGPVLSNISGVTYNSVAMTHVATRHSNDNSLGFVRLYRLVNPATGAHDIVLTPTAAWPTGTSFIGGAVSFTGVDQVTPDDTAEAVGSDTTPTVTISSNANNMVMDAAVCGNAFSATGGGQTQRWGTNGDTSSGGGNGRGSTEAGAASVTMSYTVTTDWWAIIAVNVHASGGGATKSPPPLSSRTNPRFTTPKRRMF